jgi:hypothetical protein
VIATTIAFLMPILVIYHLSDLCSYQRDVHDQRISTVNIYENHFKMMEINDYFAIFMKNGSRSAILIDKRPEYNDILMLTRSELIQLKNFTDLCILCEGHSFGECNIPQKSSISITLSPTTQLTVSSFKRCTLPDACFWFHTHFSCEDMIMISHLT